MADLVARVRFPSPEWEALVATGFSEAAAAGGSCGASVVLLDLACMGGASNNPDTAARADARRVDAVNSLLDEVATQPDVTVAALSSVVCPGGSDGLTIDGSPVRYDGVHYIRKGAALVWPWLFDELDELDQRLSMSTDDP